MKKLVIFFLVLVLVFGSQFALAKANSATSAANTLFDLGLFKGIGVNSAGDPIYDLGTEPTRAQALVMLIRLLGLEDEAIAGNWSHPFTDVPGWVQPYVGYAYENGLTLGISENTFGSDLVTNAKMYLTFVLRALKYSDSDSVADFSYDNTLAFANSIGLTDKEYPEFLRGDIAQISLAALGVKLKETGTTLIQMLVASGAVEEGKAIKAGLMQQQFKDGDIARIPAKYYGGYEAKLADIRTVYPQAAAILSTGHDGSHKVYSETYSEAEMEFLVSLNIAYIEKERNYTILADRSFFTFAKMYYSHYILDADFNILGLCYPKTQPSGRDYVETIYGNNGVDGAALYKMTKQTVDKALENYNSARIEVSKEGFEVPGYELPIHTVTVDGLPLGDNHYIKQMGIPPLVVSEYTLPDLERHMQRMMFDAFFLRDGGMKYDDGTMENPYFSAKFGGNRTEYAPKQYGITISKHSPTTLILVYEPTGKVIGYTIFNK